MTTLAQFIMLTIATTIGGVIGAALCMYAAIPL